ncbi:hypothetical protein AXG93_3022s1120 [Marchantia polymorpha subsp. ruderalis]|uniref:Reverse transcriptase RNase H-like domain-containing protein n=1 Tax=Marchantia polymorpha subsp. ruderalis TaxID=1480154 RepID=A0A176VD85_MARPO|nr:hypothetical protein AXG93_3022s1120 [Marchantia polymorpha subsp. ruderalis]
MRLHPKKCKFFQENVEYLDHVIYPRGLEVQQAKVEAIARILHLTDESRVCAFMDLANYYRSYNLFDTQFTLVIDHQLLKSLMRSDKLTGKLARWSLILHEYDFQVMHRPGVANLDANGLSRNPCTSQEYDTRAKWYCEVDEEMASDPKVEDDNTQKHDIHNDALVLEFIRPSMVLGTVYAKERDRVL